MGKINPAENEILTMAEDFRKGSNYKCQYLLSKDVKTDNIKYQIFTSKGDTKVLYNNMRLLGLTDEIWVNEALKCHFADAETRGKSLKRSPTHHIIPKCVYDKADFQHFLSERGITIQVDDGRNGIILPNGQNIEMCFSKGTAHCGSHTELYKKTIINSIKDCSSEKQLWEIIDRIKEELFIGDLSLHNNHRFNK